MPTTRKLISETVLGANATSLTISSIPGSYTDLLLFCSVRSTLASQADLFGIQFNSAGNTNLSNRSLYGFGTTVASTSASNFTSYGIPAASAVANTFGIAEVYIPNYASAVTNKSAVLTGVSPDNSGSASAGCSVALWANTAAVTQIVCYCSGGSILSGSSFYLYGITKA